MPNFSEKTLKYIEKIQLRFASLLNTEMLSVAKICVKGRLRLSVLQRVNIEAADDLVTRGARAPTVMGIGPVIRIIPISALKVLTTLFLSRTLISVIESIRNFAQSTTVWLTWSLQNCRRIHLKKLSWTNKFWILTRWILGGLSVASFPWLSTRLHYLHW